MKCNQTKIYNYEKTFAKLQSYTERLIISETILEYTTSDLDSSCILATPS
eukprot:m.35107 g.35107  ORF g.35107 m.35107 type:complete len:50 (+) comp8834_c0_seq1:108-257(+)